MRKLYPRIHLHTQTRSRTQSQMECLWSWSAVWSAEVRVCPSCLGRGSCILDTSVLVDTRVWDKHHCKKNCTNISFFFFFKHLEAEQNRTGWKLKKNAFTPSKTVRSALPVPYWGVTYSTSSIGPTYSSGIFLKVALLPFVNSNKEPA